jgi:hypothetical protein
MSAPRRAILALTAASVSLLATSASAYASPQAPETLAPPSAITATSATVHGVLNPGATATAGWYFAYSSEPTCTGAGETAHEAEVEGEKIPIETELTGLAPNTTYRYCAIATSEEGAAIEPGNQQSFTTFALPPEVQAGESTHTTAVNDDSATVEAQINPNNEPTSYTLEYSTEATGETLEGTIVKVTGEADLEGNGFQPATLSTGSVLKAGETYYYRVSAENAQSVKEATSIHGSVESFTTLPVPFTGPVSELVPAGATFNGHLALRSSPTNWFFAYEQGPSCEGEPDTTPTIELQSSVHEPALTWSVPSAEEPEHGYPAAPALQPNSEYTVCLVLSNAYGSQYGPAVHFTTTPAPPVITGESALNIGVSGIELGAMINPYLQETSYYYELATSRETLEKHEGEHVAGAAPLPTEYKQLPANVDIPAPQKNTVYYYAAVAENESSGIEGTPAYGPILSYGLPELTAQPAENITPTTATIAGTLNPESAQTTYRIAYITKAGYEKALAGDEAEKADPYAQGESTEPVTVQPTYEEQTETQTVPATQITGLLPGETYDYALIATSTIGTETTANQTLTALPAAPPTTTSEEIVTAGLPYLLTPPPTPAGTPIPATALGQEPHTTTNTGPAKLTNKQKLAKALKTCREGKKKAKRTKCEKQARKRFPVQKK